jgi:hypothetical protein
MSTLRASPYNLVYGTLVVAKASAHNDLGWSTFTNPNTIGGLMRSDPAKMTNPYREATTSES